MNMDTGEVTTVLTSEMFGLLLPEYISFAAAGDDPRHCLYRYEDGKLLVSMCSPTPNIIAIAEMDSYVQEKYTEYDGESPDILKFYGRTGVPMVFLKK